MQLARHITQTWFRLVILAKVAYETSALYVILTKTLVTRFGIHLFITTLLLLQISKSDV